MNLRARFLFLLFMAGLLVAHVIAVYTENVNWDEFALLARAADTAATGQLQSGGRPGLGTLVLLPFVRECADAITAVRGARLLWVGFTVALVSGFWVLLANLFRSSRDRFDRAALGVALFALVPVFLRFSVQVRTDQPAIALGLWGGVALIASRRSAMWAVVAGISYGIGILFSQKLIYVAALTGLLALGDLLLRREFRIRRELRRLALCAAGGLAVLLAYRALLPLFFEPARVQTLSAGMSAFAHYRADFAFGFYGLMLPTLVPHFVLLALLLNASFKASRGDDPRWRWLLLAWGILALGTAVMVFHSAALPYFWMTLGLFPAAAIAVALESILGFFPRERDRRFVVGSLWAFLLVQSALTGAVLLKDTQRVQRESLAFIDRNFDRREQGFHPERALFCRDTENPFPTIGAGITLQNRYWGPERGAQSAKLIGEFRERPVAFILESFRLAQFPPEITTFWLANYERYYESVWLPALAANGSEGARRDLVVLVPGTYRLDQPDAGREASIRLDGQTLEPGGLVELAAGRHSLQLLRDVEESALVLAVDDGPKTFTQPFYKPLQTIGFRWPGKAAVRLAGHPCAREDHLGRRQRPRCLLTRAR